MKAYQAKKNAIESKMKAVKEQKLAAEDYAKAK